MVERVLVVRYVKFFLSALMKNNAALANRRTVAWREWESTVLALKATKKC